MRKKNYKGRCEKKTIDKCKTVCKTYDPIQSAYVDILDDRNDVAEIKCNVELDGDAADFTTDIVQNKVDIIIAVEHMGEHNEYGVPNSGVYDLADACPEIDLIVAAHDHKQIDSVERNGVLIVENASEGSSVGAMSSPPVKMTAL